MEFKEKLITLLESNLTSYSIARDLKQQGFTTSAQFLDDYRSGKKDIDSMTLGKARMLVYYFEEKEEIIMKDAKMKKMVMEALSDLDEEVRGNLFEWYYEPETDTVRFEDAGMEYDGDDNNREYLFQTENREII